jgi:tetratricopeptide (TPR) repeat protein
VAAAAAARGARADALSAIGKDGAEALYVEAVCDASAARARGFTLLVDRRGAVLESLRRVAELSPDLDEAGPDRELGRFLAALPAAAGGDLREAKRHLEAAIARSPDSLRNHLVYARSVAVKEQDRAAFETHLREVLRVSPDDAEAKDLLIHENELFGPAEAAQPIPGGPTK